MILAQSSPYCWLSALRTHGSQVPQYSQDAFNKEAIARTGIFLANEFLPVFISDLSVIIGKAASAEIEQSDQQTISFHYPQLFSMESILQSIRLEIGALAAWTPAVKRTVTPYIFEYYPKLAQIMSNGDRVIPSHGATTHGIGSS